MSDAGDVDLIAGQGAKIPHARWPEKPKNIQQKQNCNKLTEDFKKWSTSTKSFKKLIEVHILFKFP